MRDKTVVLLVFWYIHEHYVVQVVLTLCFNFRLEFYCMYLFHQ